MRKYLLPTIAGIISIVLIHIIVSTHLSCEMCRWTYSTIIQAFAAMVTLVAMFTIYKLQVLTNRYENDIRELISAVKECTDKEEVYFGACLKRTEESLDFLNDERMNKEKKLIESNEQSINNKMKEIRERGEKRKDKKGNIAYSLTREDGNEMYKLSEWGWAVRNEKRILNKLDREKAAMIHTKAILKIPLIIAGALIGASFLFLSFSEESIIHSAQQFFLWCFAIAVGTAICLTIMFVEVIIEIIRT